MLSDAEIRKLADETALNLRARRRDIDNAIRRDDSNASIITDAIRTALNADRLARGEAKLDIDAEYGAPEDGLCTVTMRCEGCSTEAAATVESPGASKGYAPSSMAPTAPPADVLERALVEALEAYMGGHTQQEWDEEMARPSNGSPFALGVRALTTYRSSRTAGAGEAAKRGSAPPGVSDEGIETHGAEGVKKSREP